MAIESLLKKPSGRILNNKGDFMNLDDLTIGQVKSLERFFNNKEHQPKLNKQLGKKVLIRTDRAGVHYGTLVSKAGLEIELKDAIRIWYWKGAASLSQMAVDGVSCPEDCKFSVQVPIICLTYIEIIPCSEKAQKSIEGVPSWKA